MDASLYFTGGIHFVFHLLTFQQACIILCLLNFQQVVYKEAVFVMKERFETFTVLIAKISRNIRKIKLQEMQEYNLKNSHISCLYYLYISNGLTATELCERCEEDKATISRALDFLEQNGYLSCESKTTKRYKSPLLLTEKGTAVGQRIAERIAHVLEEVSIGLSDEERIEFYRCLSIISDNLDTIVQNYKN